MASLKELESKLREMHKRNDIKDTNKKINLCFEMMELYANIGKNFRTKDNLKKCSYVAIILSGIVQKGLEKRVVKFLKEYGDKLPEYTRIVLQTNLMRMASY